MEQETIFDEQFDEEVFVRRRDIMPVWLKIYAWVWMILGGVNVITGLPKVYAIVKLWLGSEDSDRGYLAMTSILFTNVISGIILFLMGFSIWMEYKWAIWFNWIVALMLLVFIIVEGVMFKSFSMMVQPGFWICIPFWIMLGKIHAEWHRAVKGKD